MGSCDIEALHSESSLGAIRLEPAVRNQTAETDLCRGGGGGGCEGGSRGSVGTTEILL